MLPDYICWPARFEYPLTVPKGMRSNIHRTTVLFLTCFSSVSKLVPHWRLLHFTGICMLYWRGIISRFHNYVLYPRIVIDRPVCFHPSSKRCALNHNSGFTNGNLCCWLILTVQNWEIRAPPVSWCGKCFLKRSHHIRFGVCTYFNLRCCKHPRRNRYVVKNGK